ncbi:hypothetical protein AGMMS49957_13270 [Synergistales bacterium]|nr:hypothetical protein AGMMS49957_13270 [Synergistales bacterium]
MKKIILLVLLSMGIFVSADIVKAAMGTREFIELCAKGKPNEVEAAIKNGAKINARLGEYGMTALIYAARGNPNPDVIALLLKNGADAQAREKWDGKRAIDYAGENGKLKNTAAFKQLQEASKVTIKR